MKTTMIETDNALKPIDWLKCTNDLLSYGFTREEIETALSMSGMGVSELTDEEAFENYPSYLKTMEVIKENHRFQTEKYKGEYVKKVDVQGWLIRVPAQYQGLKHGKIIDQLLYNKFAWFHAPEFQRINIIQKPFTDTWTRLKDIPEELQSLTVAQLIQMKQIERTESRWKIYEMYSKDHFELYLECDEGSLYVPLSAIMQRDFAAIEKRMIDYHCKYFDFSGYALNHRGRTKEQYENALKPLQSIQAIALKQYLTN